MFPCYALNLSHPFLPLLCPQVSSLCLRLYFCPANRFISASFLDYIYMCSVQSLSHVWLFATPWTVARQTSLSITISRSLLKLTSIESVMPSNHLILCCPLLLLPSIFPSVRVFSQCQGLFQWVSSLHQVAKVLELQHQSFQWIFRTDFL